MLEVSDPSLTETVTIATPDLSVTGVAMIVRFAPDPPNTMEDTGRRAGFDVAAVTTRLPAGVVESPIVNAMPPVERFRLIVRSAIELIVGAVFTSLTVTRKLSLALNVPSLTTIVTVALPTLPAAGVTVTVRLTSLPPSTIPPSGTSTASEVEAVTVSDAAGVVACETENGMAVVEPFTLRATSEICEMVGAVAVALTVTTKVMLEDRLPSLADIVIVVEPI